MDGTLYDRLAGSVRKHPEYSDCQIAKNIRGAVARDVAEVRKMLKGKIGRPNGTQRTDPVQTLRIDDAVRQHDKVCRVLDILKRLHPGELMRDTALRAEMQMGDTRWRRLKGSPRLGGCWYLMPDRSILWGQTGTIRELTERMKELT